MLYNALHYYTYNAYIISRIGRADTPLCALCAREDETRIHILWNCDIVRFLQDIQHCLKSNFNVTLAIHLHNWFSELVKVAGVAPPELKEL